MKKVMLLGDSIRLSYQETVKQHLHNRAEVWGPGENCRFVKYTLWCLAEWLGSCGKPDIIHWNNGIWDLYRQNGWADVFTPLEEYVAYLGRVLPELQKTGAPIIWATTTPVRPDCAPCQNERIDQYNAAAVGYMTQAGVEINDLNTLLRPDLDRFISEDGVHLTPEGVASCGRQVADTILQRLG